MFDGERETVTDGEDPAAFAAAARRGRDIALGGELLVFCVRGALKRRDCLVVGMMERRSIEYCKKVEREKYFQQRMS